MSTVFARARWTHLACWSWTADPRDVAPLVPSGVAADLFDGEAWLSLVAFRFRNLNVLGLPAVGYRDFAEINLRTYVRDEDGQPGVTFLREFVPDRLLTFLANRLFRESYRVIPGLNLSIAGTPGDTSRIRFIAPGPGTEIGIEFDSETPPWTTLDEDPLAAFLSRREYGAPHAGPPYRVTHPDWRTRRITRWRLSNPERLLADTPGFELVRERAPDAVHTFDGSEVVIHRPKRRG